MSGVLREIQRLRIHEQLRDRYQELFREHVGIGTLPRHFFSKLVYTQLLMTKDSHDAVFLNPRIIVADQLIWKSLSATPMSFFLPHKWRKDPVRVGKSVHVFCKNVTIMLGHPHVVDTLSFDKRSFYHSYVTDLHKAASQLFQASASPAQAEALLAKATHVNIELDELRLLFIPRATRFAEAALDLTLSAMAAVKTVAGLPEFPVVISCEASGVTVSVGDVSTRRLTYERYLWLREQYSKTNGGELVGLPTALFRMLKRYECLDTEAGVENMQAAVPNITMEGLHNNLGVTFECFASPINATFPSYCSAFPDTDVPFGSKGRFQDYWTTGGSFQCNPPFVGPAMEASLAHIVRLVNAAVNPISFVIFLPDRVAGNSAVYLEPLNTCTIPPRKYLLPPYEQQYELAGAVFPCPWPTRLVLIQNESGQEKWPFMA